MHYVKFQTYLWRNSREKNVWTQYLCRKCIMEKTAFKSTCVLCWHISQKLLCIHYWIISNATVCVAGVFIYHNTIFFRFTFCHYSAFFNISWKHLSSLSFILPKRSIYNDGACHKIYSLSQNTFFCRIKCVYKASLIICLHKYVNNSIYVFEPKFTKSRLILSGVKHQIVNDLPTRLSVQN